MLKPVSRAASARVTFTSVLPFTLSVKVTLVPSCVMLLATRSGAAVLYDDVPALTLSAHVLWQT